MAQSQLSKDIKKLNERLAEFERHGAQHSEQYQSLINKLQTLTKNGLVISTSKSGHTSIKNSVKYGEALQERLGKLAQGKNTYGRAKKQAVRMLEERGISKDRRYFAPNGEEMPEWLTDKDYMKNAFNVSDKDYSYTLKQYGYTDSEIDEFLHGEEDYIPFESRDGFSDDEINEVLALSYEVHDIVTAHAEAIYYLEQKGELQLHGNDGKLDVATMEKIKEVEGYSNQKRAQMARRYKESKEKAKKAKTTNYLNKQKENEAKSKGISLNELDELNNIMSELSIFSDYVPTEQEIIRAIRYGTVEELKRKNRDGVF